MGRPPLPDTLHICLIASRFPLLGRAAHHGFIWPIARGLAQRGHRVTVLSWRNPENRPHVEQEKVNAYFLGVQSQHVGLDRFPGLVLKKFEEIHKADPIHVVHSFDSAGFEIGKLRRRYRTSIAFDVEATQMSQIFSIIAMSRESVASLIRTGLAVLWRFLVTYLGRDRHLLLNADGMFVTTPQQALALERYYLYPSSRTYLVPYGIEIADLSPREKSDELRRKLNLPQQAKVAVTVTDMTDLEEMRIVLKAFEQVVIKKPQARLLVVGSGPLRKEVEFEMLSLALGSKVVFAGNVSSTDLPDYIALADVYVNVSSRNSGYEPSQIEAMAQRKVVVGSEFSPLSSVVDDGLDGFLIRPADWHSLSSLLHHIFNGELPAQELGEKARQKVINLFDTQKMVSATIEAYYSVLRRSGYYSQRRTWWSLFSRPAPGLERT